jgi:hypothetical protein
MRRRSQEDPGSVWRRRGRCDGRSGGSRESQARIGQRRAQAARGLKGFFPPSRLARGRGRGRDATGAKHGRALDTRPPSRLPSPTLTLRPTSDPAEHPRGSDAAEGPFSALVRPYQARRAFPFPPFPAQSPLTRRAWTRARGGRSSSLLTSASSSTMSLRLSHPTTRSACRLCRRRQQSITMPAQAAAGPTTTAAGPRAPATMPPTRRAARRPPTARPQGLASHNASPCRTSAGVDACSIRCSER